MQTERVRMVSRTAIGQVKWQPTWGEALSEVGEFTVNVHFVRRQTDRRNSNFSSQRHSNTDDREYYGRRQGRAQGNNSGRLNPNTQQFNPHTEITPVNSDRNERSQNNEAQTLNN